MKSRYLKETSSPIDSTTNGHIPVLLEEVIALLKPSPGKIIVDATFGAGGYSHSFCQMGSSVIALDRDPLAVAAGQEIMKDYIKKKNFSLRSNFFSIKRLCP